MSDDIRFSRSQERLMAALLTAPNVEAAAREIGLSSRQAHRLIRMPAFYDRWQQLRQEAISLALHRAQREMVNNVEALCRLRDDPKTPGNAKVAAIGRLIDLATAAAETEAQQETVRRLEQQMAEIREFKETPTYRELPPHRSGSDDPD
jgi:hypothetical protein